MRMLYKENWWMQSTVLYQRYPLCLWLCYLNIIGQDKIKGGCLWANVLSATSFWHKRQRKIYMWSLLKDRKTQYCSYCAISCSWTEYSLSITVCLIRKIANTQYWVEITAASCPRYVDHSIALCRHHSYYHCWWYWWR